MRLGWMLAAGAVLLAACKVEVDGAPCAVAGATSDCPDRQACGNDLRCSARALACAGSRCTPGETRCNDVATAARCVGSDPVCGSWVVDSCAGRGMECGTHGTTACECPAAVGAVVVADPRSESVPGAPPFPNGQASPPECRFGRLWDALAAASSVAPAAVTVEIAGAPGAPVVLGAATGEEWPLVVPANAAVLAAAAPAGPTIIRGEPELTTTLVEVRGVLDGVRVEGGGATGVGVALSCGASGAPSLRRVEVDGGGATMDPTAVLTTGLTGGVTFSGACAARLSSVEVAGVNGAALTISADPTAATTVEVLGGSYGASNFGIWIRGGKVNVAPDPESSASVVVSGNRKDGVVIGGHAGRGLPLTLKAVNAVLDRVFVCQNAGTGLILAGMPGTSRLRVTGLDIAKNGLVRPATYGPVDESRDVGGAAVWLGSTPLEFSGNRLWANGGDQLGFESSANDWSISASTCGPETNVFACVTAYAVGIVGGGWVQAAYTAWPGTPASVYVSANVTDYEPPQYCTSDPGVRPMPSCL